MFVYRGLFEVCRRLIFGISIPLAILKHFGCRVIRTLIKLALGGKPLDAVSQKCHPGITNQLIKHVLP